jgi:hypothetical protein
MWSDIDIDRIEIKPGTKDRFFYNGKILRFQIPRGLCVWGVSAYSSLNITLPSQEFVDWWKRLETHLCPRDPFSSNLKGPDELRLKIDRATYIFDENSKQILPEVKEGLFRGHELSCLVDVESNYFFNGSWGLVCRAAQIKTYTPDEPVVTEAPVFQKGQCAFL